MLSAPFAGIFGSIHEILNQEAVGFRWNCNSAVLLQATVGYAGHSPALAAGVYKLQTDTVYSTQSG